MNDEEIQAANQVPQMTIADLPSEIQRNAYTRSVDPQRDPHPVTSVQIMSDEPDGSGAAHRYRIEIAAVADPSAEDPWTTAWEEIKFQQGPIGEHGVNGIHNEQLLAIVIDRLEGFQRGPFPCYHNGQAIEEIKCALWHLKSRTAERIARGVEGTNTA